MPKRLLLSVAEFIHGARQFCFLRQIARIVGRFRRRRVDILGEFLQPFQRQVQPLPASRCAWFSLANFRRRYALRVFLRLRTAVRLAAFSSGTVLES